MVSARAPILRATLLSRKAGHRLDQQLARVRRDLGRGASHHASQSDRLLLIGNHAHSRLEVVRAMVNGQERLPRQRLADNDLPGCQLGKVRVPV